MLVLIMVITLKEWQWQEGGRQENEKMLNNKSFEGKAKKRSNVTKIPLVHPAINILGKLFEIFKNLIKIQQVFYIFN